MGDVYYVNKHGKTRKKIDWKEKWENAKQKASDFMETCKQNKETVIAVASVVIPGAIEIGKMAVKNRDKREENDRRKRAMWDPVEGHWWYLRRELTSSEYLEVERRVRDGEARGEVLDDMGLLRKR